MVHTVYTVSCIDATEVGLPISRSLGFPQVDVQGGLKCIYTLRIHIPSEKVLGSLKHKIVKVSKESTLQQSSFKWRLEPSPRCAKAIDSSVHKRWPPPWHGVAARILAPQRDTLHKRGDVT